MPLICNTYMDVVSVNRRVTGAAENQVIHHLGEPKHEETKSSRPKNSALVRLQLPMSRMNTHAIEIGWIDHDR